MKANSTITVAGAGGDLGGRIVNALVTRGAIVRALVKPNTTPAEQARIENYGATVVAADPIDEVAMAKVLVGSTCVVSALNGLRDVIIDRQTILLNAAVKAGVPRFIPSDYSADFTKTRVGDNRNFDLRREFKQRVDQTPIKATSILNGAFMDMLGNEMPIIQRGIHRVLYWHDADQLLDFTTKDDVAAFVAAAAMDDTTPRILRVAGDSISVRGIAESMSQTSGHRYRPLWVGSIRMLSAMIGVTKIVAAQADVTFPPWQGMQYMRDMFNGSAKLDPLDNDRYADLKWTSVSALLAGRSR